MVDKWIPEVTQFGHHWWNNDRLRDQHKADQEQPPPSWTFATHDFKDSVICNFMESQKNPKFHISNIEIY